MCVFRLIGCVIMCVHVCVCMISDFVCVSMWVLCLM